MRRTSSLVNVPQRRISSSSTMMRMRRPVRVARRRRRKMRPVRVARRRMQSHQAHLALPARPAPSTLMRIRTGRKSRIPSRKSSRGLLQVSERLLRRSPRCSDLNLQRRCLPLKNMRGKGRMRRRSRSTLLWESKVNIFNPLFISLEPKPRDELKKIARTRTIKMR